MDPVVAPRCYFDPGVFEREQRQVFQRTWQFVGFAGALSHSQDFVTRDVGGVPVVVQNVDGVLRAFRNVCSHRFNRILTAASGCGPLRCGYHGWTYDGAGRPTGIPRRPRFDDLSETKLTALALESWRVETCGAAVFVCRDQAAPPLRAYLGSVFDLVEAMTRACGPQIDENVMVIRANWKVLVENTLESYHVGFVHPTTFDRLALQEGAFTWHAPHSTWTTDIGEAVARRMGSVDAAFAARTWRTPGYLHQFVFPGLTLATTKGVSFSIQSFEPIDASHTRFTSTVFQAAVDGDEPPSPAMLAVNDAVKIFNRSVFAEDRDVCQQVQLGVVHADKPGILSDEELRVHAFQQAYARCMGGDA